MAIASQNIKTLKNPLFELETHLRACEAKMGSEIFFFPSNLIGTNVLKPPRLKKVGVGS